MTHSHLKIYITIQPFLESRHQTSSLRNACILGCAMYGGMRSEEIADLIVNDYDLREGQFTIEGKGRVTRKIEVVHGLGLALWDWMECRNSESGHMFQRINKGGRVYAEGISPQSIQNAFVKCAKEAGIYDLTSHDGRRRFISTLLDYSDVSTVKGIAGHANTNTTAGYDRRGNRARQSAMGNLHMEWSQ